MFFHATLECCYNSALLPSLVNLCILFVFLLLLLLFIFLLVPIDTGVPEGPNSSESVKTFSSKPSDSAVSSQFDRSAPQVGTSTPVDGVYTVTSVGVGGVTQNVVGGSVVSPTLPHAPIPFVPQQVPVSEVYMSFCNAHSACPTQSCSCSYVCIQNFVHPKLYNWFPQCHTFR